MKKFLCRAPSCYSILDESGYCSKHKGLEIEANRKKEEHFKRLSERKKDYQQLYYTAEWRKITKELKTKFPICQRCNNNPTTDIHHISRHYGDETLFFDRNNLIALCNDCHNVLEMQILRNSKPK